MEVISLAEAVSQALQALQDVVLAQKAAGPADGVHGIQKILLQLSTVIASLLQRQSVLEQSLQDR